MKWSQSNPRSLTRRGFLATIAAGGATAGVSLVTHAQDATPVPAGSPAAGALVATDLPATWDYEVDVVSVGTGAAGFGSAVAAAQAGADVLILEKSDFLGGTTQISGNAYWIPNNSKMVEIGLTDPREDALMYLARLSYPQLYDPASPTLGLMQHNYDLNATYYDTAAVAIDAFESWGALYSMIQPGFGYSESDISDPDYHADLPEDKAPYGRTLIPNAELGGGGATVPVQMKAWTDAQGIPVLMEHRVTGVFQNAAREVIGVQADNNGVPVNIRARKAVVFGSGGFTQDQYKSLNYLRGPIFAGCGVGSNTGDFVDIGLALGARLGNMNQAWWLQCPLELALQSSSLPGADVWMAFGDSMIIVNKYGDRIMTEKMTYNERGQTHFTWSPTTREYPNLVQFMIFDDAVRQSTTEWAFRWPVPMPDEESDLLIAGETWEELAANINARLDSVRGQGSITGRVGPGVSLADDFVTRLGASIERLNGFAESGVDEDYGRGSTPIQIAWNGPGREGNTSGNPTMFPISSEGPYYCIMLGAMTLDTKGGPATDAGARVLHVSGNPIPGLYAAGNCAASPSGQAYWSAGGTIGPALTFGYIAGQNAAAEPEKAI